MRSVCRLEGCKLIAQKLCTNGHVVILRLLKKTNKSKGCIKNKSALLFRRKKKRKKLMADKCTSFLDLLSFPFTSLVCKSLFIFPVFWTLTKWNQFKLSFLSAIAISYFWTRHLCITHCFSTLSVLSHTVALSQHICCLQNVLLDCHIMPQTIFCILKTAEFQSLLYQHNQEQIIPCLWISSEK